MADIQDPIVSSPSDTSIRGRAAAWITQNGRIVAAAIIVLALVISASVVTVIPGEAVVVTMSRMPGKILSPEAMIDSTRDSLLKALGATLESEKKADAANESLLFFKSAAAVFESRLVVEDDRLFQVLYVGRSEEQRTAPAVTQLFESFSIAKAEPAVAAEPAAAAAETSGQ